MCHGMRVEGHSCLADGPDVQPTLFATHFIANRIIAIYDGTAATGLWLIAVADCRR